MTADVSAVAERCGITVPDHHRRPIAVVGAGAIVDVAHLPAYRAHGLVVRGLFDRNRAVAERVAARHGVPTVYSSIDELLADPAVEVVDLAVPPSAQAVLAPQVFAAGRHLLCQKPLALDATTARRMVDAAAAARVHIAVNQQMRYDEGVAAAKAMIDLGWIGDVTSVRFDVDITTDWTAWPWLVTSPELDFRFHSIHYVDTIRYVLGDPDAVFGRATGRPGQIAAGETRTTAALLYPGDRQALITVNHENPTDEPQARIRIDGGDGRIEVELGLLADYPHGGPDRVRAWVGSRWVDYPVMTKWIPDAFIGPMAGLLRAIAGEGPAPTSGEDNIGTVAVVDALYESARTGTVVRLRPP
jgi:predicted dehydrogenase